MQHNRTQVLHHGLSSLSQSVKATSVTGATARRSCMGLSRRQWSLYLYTVQSIPYNRIAEIMTSTWWRNSRGHGEKHFGKNKSKATPVYDSILSFIRETVCRLAWMRQEPTSTKKLCWFWCLQCPKYCYVFADESRGICPGKPQHHSSS